MKRTRRKIAVLLLVALLIPYVGIVKHPKAVHDIPAVKAVSISEETEWNIRYMSAENSYEESQNRKQIKVAVLDSGLDYDEDIPFVERKDFLGEPELHPIYQDKTGHGTSVAGLICARRSDDRITGIAANVDLYAGRILDADNKAPIDRVIEGIRWAMEKKVDIIHMSYGTPDYDEELEEVINQAYEQGILLVAAAGNEGTAAEDESTVEYPAAFDNVIAVGATNADNKKTEISSSGYELDIVAPGDQILSAGAFGGVVVEEGTTISAAQVTGVAAVLWGKYPDKSNEFIRGLLVSGANAEAVDENCGNGIVDYEQSKQNYEKMNAVYKVFKQKGMTEKLAVEKAEESVGENRKRIREAGSVTYVNGAWSGATHAGYVTDVEHINIVKRGAIEPDILDSMKLMGKHPSFHGGGNYLANTKYLIDFARQLKNAEDDTWMGAPKFTGGNEKSTISGSKNIDEELENRVLTEFYQKCGVESEGENQNHRRAYAITGLAIHTMTDAFAHCGYRKDTKYGEGFCQILHDRNIEDSAKAIESTEQRKIRLNSPSYFWKQMIGQNRNKAYYQYFYDHFAVADDAGKMGIRSFLAQQCAKNMIAAMKDDGIDLLESFRTIFTNYKTDYHKAEAEVDKPENYRILELSNYWQQLKGEKGQFADLNINDKDVDRKLKLPAKKEVKVTVKGKKMTVTFPKEKNYKYAVYYRTNRKQEDNQVFFSENKKFTASVKKMSGSYIYIVATYGGKKKEKSIQVSCKIRYIYKKYRKTQTYYFKAKQTKYKLGTTVKQKIRKKLKGWSIKQGAKKADYKVKGSIPFPGTGTSKLYGVAKK